MWHVEGRIGVLLRDLRVCATNGMSHGRAFAELAAVCDIHPMQGEALHRIFGGRAGARPAEPVEFLVAMVPIPNSHLQAAPASMRGGVAIGFQPALGVCVLTVRGGFLA